LRWNSRVFARTDTLTARHAWLGSPSRRPPFRVRFGC
jgi:hypothetical protein